MTQQLMHRFWCGALPLFSLPSGDAERQADDHASLVFFGSDAFATLRMRLRLALQELPTITQSRRVSTAQLTTALELAERYQQHVLVLLRYSPHSPQSTSSVSALETTYPPLFHGFGGADLSADRLVGKENRLSFSLPVDVVLVGVLLGQLHALQAEALVDQGLKLQSEAIISASDASWRSSTLQFTRAAGLASAAMSQCIKGDPQVASVVKFYSGVATQAIVMARLAQMHRASACITSLLLVDETTERLARNAAVCARYAFTVAMQTRDVADVLDDSSLSKQLAWLVRSYITRWRLIFYSYEQTVFQLDFQPEIAMLFGELIQRGERLQPLPEYSHRHDSYFTRVAHDIQTSHGSHLNESLDLKTTLVGLCQRKFGSMWSFEPLPRELMEEFASIEPIEELFGRDNIEDSADEGIVDDDRNVLTVEAIVSNVQQAKQRTGQDTASVIVYSTKAVNEERSQSESPQTKPTTEAAQNPNQSGSRIERPSSAGLLSSCSSKSTISRAKSSSEWVSMRVAGGKTLLFEPLPSPPSAKVRPSTAGSIVTKGHRRNAVPMVMDDTTDAVADSSLGNTRPRLKSIRPSSSPSYLASSTTPKKKGPEVGGLTWVPTRASCALCERRFMRQNLPGVVVMKRVFDLRRKWGMVLQDSKKFNAASALYGRASVCLTCQDILTFEDDKDSLNNPGSLAIGEQPLDDMGVLIRNRILADWQQRPASSDELLLDVAVNKRARQSSTNFGLNAPNAVQSGSLRTAHTREEQQPWWEVDLANYYVIHSVKVWLREDTSHVYSFGGHRQNSSSTHIAGARKMAATSELALSSVGFLHSGSGGSMACGALAPAPQPNLGLYPLHITVSMKSGTDRDLDDILASSVSSHTIAEKAVQPITWLTPPNCRGRFVRIQAEGVAFLHIERVNVFVSQNLPTQTATMKRETARNQLKRAAFRASVIGKKPSPQLGSSTFDPRDASLAALTFESRTKPPLNYTTSGGPKHEPKGFISAFTDPEQAEKRRISRLYQKFKGLLDARTKYTPSEDRDEEARVRFEE